MIIAKYNGGEIKMSINSRTYIENYNKNKGKYSETKKRQLINLIDCKINKQKSRIDNLNLHKSSIDASLVISIISLIFTGLLALKDNQNLISMSIAFGGIAIIVSVGFCFSKETRKNEKNQLHIQEIRKSIHKLEIQKTVYTNLIIDEHGTTP